MGSGAGIPVPTDGTITATDAPGFPEPPRIHCSLAREHYTRPPILLLVLVAVFCGLTVFRVIVVSREAAVRAWHLPFDDSLHGLQGRVLGFAVFGAIAAALIRTFAPAVRPLSWLEHSVVEIVGVVLAGAAIVWIAIAQVQMGSSFRVGVNPAERTALVRRRVFAVSRNPIYLGVGASALGFFLMAPGALTLAVLVAAVIGLSVQARLEEAHLLRQHPTEYPGYRDSVRRWL